MCFGEMRNSLGVFFFVDHLITTQNRFQDWGFSMGYHKSFGPFICLVVAFVPIEVRSLSVEDFGLRE